MLRLTYWCEMWKRSWESAYGKRPTGQRGSRYPDVRKHHRKMLLWMILHPFKASR